MIDYASVIGVAVRVASDDSSDSNLRNLAFVFLFAGFVFYGAMFIRYRNVDKRDHYESETKASIEHVHGNDTHVQSLHRVRNSRMSGANNTAVRGARNKLF